MLKNYGVSFFETLKILMNFSAPGIIAIPGSLKNLSWTTLNTVNVD